MSSPRSLALLVMVSLGCLTTNVPAETIGYWRFEGPDDTTGFLSDSSGNGHVLSRQFTTPGAEQIALPSTGPGSAFPKTILPSTPNNHAAIFASSTSGRLFAAYNPAFLVNTFTIEAFFSPRALVANTVMVGQFSVADERRWFLGPTSGSQLRFGLSSNGTGSTTLDTNAGNWVGPTGQVSAALAVDRDYFVAASVTLATSGTLSGLVTFYLQDLTAGGPLLTQTRTHSVASLHESNADLSIGRFSSGGPSQQFPGLIDEVRFSSGLLSPDQLLVVPEPRAWLLVLAVGLVFAMMRRQRSGKG